MRVERIDLAGLRFGRVVPRSAQDDKCHWCSVGSNQSPLLRILDGGPPPLRRVQVREMFLRKDVRPGCPAGCREYGLHGRPVARSCGPNQHGYDPSAFSLNAALMLSRFLITML